jgi:hypothetical protein
LVSELEYGWELWEREDVAFIGARRARVAGSEWKEESALTESRRRLSSCDPLAKLSLLLRADCAILLVAILP